MQPLAASDLSLLRCAGRCTRSSPPRPLDEDYEGQRVAARALESELATLSKQLASQVRRRALEEMVDPATVKGKRGRVASARYVRNKVHRFVRNKCRTIVVTKSYYNEIMLKREVRSDLRSLLVSFSYKAQTSGNRGRSSLLRLVCRQQSVGLLNIAR